MLSQQHGSREALQVLMLASLLLLGCDNNRAGAHHQKAAMNDNNHYFVRFSDTTPREGWGAADKAVFQEHIEYLRRMETLGRLRYAGLAKDPDSGTLAFGFALYAASSSKEAQTLMHEDPGVKRGLLKADLEEMHTFFGHAP